MHGMKKSSLKTIALLIGMFFMLHTGAITALAEEQEIDARLESAEIEGTDGSPTIVIEVEGGSIGGPNEPNRPGDSDQPGGPDGANPGGPGGPQEPGADEPGSGQSPSADDGANAEEPDVADGAGQDDSKANDPDSSDNEANSPESNVNPPDVEDPNDNVPGDEQSDPNADDPTAGDGGNADSEDKKSWWDRFKEWATSDAVVDNLKKLGRGLVVGIIGAAAVVGVVLLAAALLGVAISAPVWIAALAVGIIAGVIYSFASGDSFDFIKGIGVSALAAIATIGILQAGIAGAAQAAFQFIRSSGVRGLASLVSRGASSLWGGVQNIVRQGMALGFKQMMSTAVRGIPGLMKSWLFNKTVGFQFVLGMGFSTASHMLGEGTIPTPKDLLFMGVESVLAAAVFGKAVDLIKGAVSSKWLTRASHFVFGGLQSMVVDRIKGKQTNWGEALTSAMLSAFIIGPAVQRFFQSSWFYGIRTKIGAGLTMTDIKNRFGNSVTVTVGPKQISNRQLMLILTTKPENLTRQQQTWLQSGVISQRQLTMLQENQVQFEKFIELKSFFMQSMLEQSVKPDNYKQLQQPPAKGGGKPSPVK